MRQGMVRLAGAGVLRVGAGAPGQSAFDRIWRKQVAEIKGHPLELNQIFIALLILVLGYLVSRWLVARFRNYLLVTRGADRNSAALASRILLYVLVVTLVLIALDTVQIPLAMFAFLGGAVAIGAGFGAQNIFKNFISGLILMIERPVRIGDIIDVGGNQGRVTEIGGRSTRIRRLDGVEMMVPNSALLENNVVNMTLTDNLVRTSVTVGVAYGSPLDQVQEIIKQVAGETVGVLKQPEPVVVFENFGNSSLVFQVYFWLEIKEIIDLRTVAGAVRLKIDERFRRAGITVAFPQTDVHFDRGRPLEVKLLGEEKAESSKTDGGASEDGVSDTGR